MSKVLAEAPIIRKNKRQKVTLTNHSHDAVDDNKTIDVFENASKIDDIWDDGKERQPQYTKEQIEKAPMRGKFKAEKQNRDFPRVVKDDNGMNVTVASQTRFTSGPDGVYQEIDGKNILWEELEVTNKACIEWPIHEHYPNNIQDWKEYMFENAFVESNDDPQPDEVYDDINEKEIENDFKSGLIVDHMVSWNNWENIADKLKEKYGVPPESKMVNADAKTKDIMDLVNDIVSLEESLEELDTITNYKKFTCQWREEVSKIHNLILKLKSCVLENPTQPIRNQLSRSFTDSALEDIKMKHQILFDYIEKDESVLAEVDDNG